MIHLSTDQSTTNKFPPTSSIAGQPQPQPNLPVPGQGVTGFIPSFGGVSQDISGVSQANTLPQQQQPNTPQQSQVSGPTEQG